MKAVTDNPGASRYELRLDDELVAFVRYRDTGELVDLVHTETAAGYEGRGLAATLIAGVLDDLRGKGRKLRPSCPYVRRYLGKHPDQLDLVPDDIAAEISDGV